MDAKSLGSEPVAFVSSDADRSTPDKNGFGYQGLTKRELFAGMAMQGLLAKHGEDDYPAETLSQYARKHADALLAELAKDQP